MRMVILLLPGRSPVQSTDQILLLLLAILLLLYANFHKGVFLQELNMFPLISFAFPPKTSQFITNSDSEVQINEISLSLQ